MEAGDTPGAGSGTATGGTAAPSTPTPTFSLQSSAREFPVLGTPTASKNSLKRARPAPPPFEPNLDPTQPLGINALNLLKPHAVVTVPPPPPQGMRNHGSGPFTAHATAVAALKDGLCSWYSSPPPIPSGPATAEVTRGNWAGICGGPCRRMLSTKDAEFDTYIKSGKSWWCLQCYQQEQHSWAKWYMEPLTCSRCNFTTMSRLLWSGVGIGGNKPTCPYNPRTGYCAHSFDAFKFGAVNISKQDQRFGVHLEIPYKAIPAYLYAKDGCPLSAGLECPPRSQVDSHYLWLVDEGYNFDPWAADALSKMRVITDGRNQFCLALHPSYVPCRMWPCPESPLRNSVVDTEQPAQAVPRCVEVEEESGEGGTQVTPPPPTTPLPFPPLTREE